MEFSEYRSQVLKALWVRVFETYLLNTRSVVSQPGFSTSSVDDICAVNWKYANPIGVCVSALLYYVEDFIKVEV